MSAPATLTPPTIRSSGVAREVEYPYSDGRVLMDADPHANAIVAMRNQLQWNFESLSNVYVAGSLAVFYREGDPRAVVAPDVFVALGVQKKERKSYRIWDEAGVVPAFVVEVTSPSTTGRDATSKQETYEQMAVREYWRFDPTGLQIQEGLMGWRLETGRYERVPGESAAGWYRSGVLGLELRAEGWLLRFRDPRLGRDLMTHLETNRALQVSERKAEAEASARLEAERERDEAKQRLRELQARLRLSSESG